MAHLLGSKNCLQSLSKDISNMQDTINSMLKKTGRLEVASWKFPGKVAVELDIANLLDDYSFCKDTASNELSHIILFELVIDRFCLLLQAACQLFDLVFISDNESNSPRPQSRTVTSTMSVGLIVKIFWNKISQIQYTYQNLEKQYAEHNQSLMDLENVFSEMKIENESLKRKTFNNKSKVKEKIDEREKEFKTKERAEKIVQSDTTRSFSTQTFETSFVPCEACSRMQNNLLKVGTEIIHICESQGLPSSLSKQRKLMKDIQMTAADVTRWTNEQGRDLNKINDYLHNLFNQINPMKEQLNSSNVCRVKLENDLSSVCAENEKFKLRLDDLKNECQLHEETKKQLARCENKMKELDDRNIELEKENEGLKISVEETAKDLSKYGNNITALEQGMKSLSSQLDHENKEKEKLLKSHSEISTLKTQKIDLEQQLEAVGIERDKMKAENKVILKHDQGLQTKQATLLSRLEQLDETCEELRNELSEVKEEKSGVLKNNIKLVDEKKNLISEVENLKNIIQVSAENCHAQKQSTNDIDTMKSRDLELTEKIKLLVCYPVIGDKYKSAEEEYTKLLCDPRFQVESDNDVIEDMERQLQTNNIRLSILEEQNKSLRSSLLKLEERTSAREFETSGDESKRKYNRFNETDGTHSLNESRHHSAPISSSHQLVTPKPPSEPRSSTRPTRTWSGGISEKKESFNIGARLANLERLRDKTKISKFDWNTETEMKMAWNDKVANVEDGSVLCPDCDKTYLSKRDLEIHKTFCYGR